MTLPVIGVELYFPRKMLKPEVDVNTYYYYFRCCCCCCRWWRYYWVYLSSDHLFQVYYKVRQVLLQSATAFFITKCDGLLLQSATAFLLQSATSVITKCDRYYKVRRLLQSATAHAIGRRTFLKVLGIPLYTTICARGFKWEKRSPQIDFESF